MAVFLGSAAYLAKQRIDLLGCRGIVILRSLGSALCEIIHSLSELGIGILRSLGLHCSRSSLCTLALICRGEILLCIGHAVQLRVIGRIRTVGYYTFEGLYRLGEILRLQRLGAFIV